MTLSKIIKKITHKFRKHYYKNKINNHNVTILSNDCSAGFIYHHYGLKFYSPTINLYFDKNDFLIFAGNIRNYINGELLDDGINNGCPSGVLVAGNNLPPIKLFFLHYDSFESGKFFWEKRKKRINMENIIIIYNIVNFYEYCNRDILDQFNNLKYKKVLLYCRDTLDDISFVKEKYQLSNNRFWEYKKGLLSKFLDNRILFEYDFIQLINGQ